jgi:hypothetical protein
MAWSSEGTVSEPALVATLWNPDNPSVAWEVEQLRAAAQTLGLELSAFFAKPPDIEASFAVISSAAMKVWS